MVTHRKASALIAEATELALDILYKTHATGPDFERKVADLRAEIAAAAVHDCSGRGQFLNGAPSILVACLGRVLLEHPGASSIAWKMATAPFITLARRDGFSALEYEHREGVI
jgi:hypothetical protein